MRYTICKLAHVVPASNFIVLSLMHRRYTEEATKYFLAQEQDFYWCPGPNCESGQLHVAGTDNPIFTCVACKYRACVACNSQWHAGQTCREYKRAKHQESKNMQEERRSARTLRHTTKLCPGPRCGRKVEKRGGCDHMTCKHPGLIACVVWRADRPQVPCVATNSAGSVSRRTSQFATVEIGCTRKIAGIMHELMQYTIKSGKQWQRSSLKALP